MSDQTWWLLFGAPLLVMAVAWIGLLKGWGKEASRILMTIAMLFPTAAVILACGGLAYVHWGGKVKDALEFYGDVFFLSLPGVALGFVVALKFRRWFSALALGVSAWMVVLFGMMMSAAD